MEQVFTGPYCVSVSANVSREVNKTKRVQRLQEFIALRLEPLCLLGAQ